MKAIYFLSAALAALCADAFVPNHPGVRGRTFAALNMAAKQSQSAESDAKVCLVTGASRGIGRWYVQYVPNFTHLNLYNTLDLQTRVSSHVFCSGSVALELNKAGNTIVIVNDIEPMREEAEKVSVVSRDIHY